MKRVHVSTAAALLARIAVVTMLATEPVAAQEKPAQAVQKWEYKVVQVSPTSLVQADFEEKLLNRLGAEGWELCSTITPTPRGTDQVLVALIFKRPKR